MPPEHTPPDSLPPLPTTPPPDCPDAPACVSLGRPLPPSPARPIGRDYRECEHPAKPRGRSVCSCDGCGPSCWGYDADAEPVNPPVGLRHLMHFVLPVKGSPAWTRAADRLRRAWHLFDGRRLVAVGTSAGGPVRSQGDGGGRVLELERPEVVRAYYPPGCEFFEVPTSPLWELPAFELMAGELSGADGRDAVLYTHAKGVTRPYSSPCHEWSELLWSVSLDYWSRTARLLRHFPLCGPFVRRGRFPAGENPAAGLSRSLWHYSGNFWWARLGALRGRLASHPVPPDKWGLEAWPGLAFGSSDASSVWTPKDSPFMYDPAAAARVIAEFQAWRAVNPPEPTPAAHPSPSRAYSVPKGRPTLSVIVPTSGRASLSRTLGSVRAQLLPGDELIVARDGSADWGMTPRNNAMRRAAGDLLLFMDDDDVYTPGALDAVRAAALANPGRPLMFRMSRGAPFNDVVPGPRVVRPGNVSGQCFAAPNDPARLGSWGIRYEGDFDFIRSTLDAHEPGALVWCDDVISEWRPVQLDGAKSLVS